MGATRIGSGRSAGGEVGAPRRAWGSRVACGVWGGQLSDAQRGAPAFRILRDSEPPRGRRRGEVSVTRLNLFDNDPLGQVRSSVARSQGRQHVFPRERSGGLPRLSQPPSHRAPARDSDLCVGRSKRNFLHNVSFSCLHRLCDFPAPGSVFFLLLCKAFCGLHYHLLNTLQLAIYLGLQLPDLCCFLSTSRDFSNKSLRRTDRLSCPCLHCSP